MNLMISLVLFFAGGALAKKSSSEEDKKAIGTLSLACVMMLGALVLI